MPANRTPRSGLGAPESTEPPFAGTERRPGVPNGPQAGAQSLDRAEPAAPEQLTLPAELIAAVCLPVPIPSARRRGRRVHHLPDISNYQPEETR